jgi:site-specific recombinase XerD
MVTAHGSAALVRGWRLALTVRGLRPHTVQAYVRDVERFTGPLNGQGPKGITPADLREYFITYQEGRSPKTVRECQLALRSFFRFLASEGEVRKDPTRDMRLAKYTVEPQPTYTESEVKRLLMACDHKTLDGLRNRAMVMVLFDTGVRESELLSMTMPDFEGRRTRVSGKTGTRDVPLGTATLQAVEKYLRRWRITEAPVWRGKRGPLTRSGVLQVTRRLCRQAGVQEKGVHAFRRAAAAAMKRNGMQDSDILEVCGWKDITMLRRYTAEVADELAAAAHRKYSPGDAIAAR